MTAPGGDPNDFSSVKLFLFNVFNASCAASNAGSAFTKSSSQSSVTGRNREKKHENVVVQQKNMRNFFVVVAKKRASERTKIRKK